MTDLATRLAYDLTRTSVVASSTVQAATFAALRLMSEPAEGTVAIVAGRATTDDGYAGSFAWDTASVLADDNADVLAITGVTTGRWLRLDGPTGALADLSVTTAKLAAAAVTTAKIAAGTIVDSNISTSAAIAGGKLDWRTVYVHCFGDSITEGVSNPVAEQCSYRGMLQDMARRCGDDIRMLGTRHGWGVSNSAGQGVMRWPTGTDRHDGVSGDTIAQVTARISAAVSGEYTRTGRYADVMVVLVGVNDYGSTPAAAAIRYGTMIDTFLAANPTGHLICCAIGRVPANPSFQASLNTLIEALVATKGSRVSYLSTASGFTRAEMGTYASAEDAHPHRRGLTKLARGVYDKIRSLFPLRTGLPSPRPFTARTAVTSLSLSAGANGINRGGGAFETAIEVSGTSWLVGVNVYMGTLPASAWSAICGYGSPYNSGGFMVAVYGGSTGTAGLYGTGSASSLVSAQYAVKAATWHRFWVHYDGTSGHEVLSFWGTPNDKPVLFGCVTGALSFASSWKNLFLGYGGTSNAPACYLDNAVFCAGSSVPRFDDALSVIEAEYFEGAGLPGSLASFFTDDTSGYTDGHDGTDAAVWSGSASTATQAHQWDG